MRACCGAGLPSICMRFEYQGIHVFTRYCTEHLFGRMCWQKLQCGVGSAELKDELKRDMHYGYGAKPGLTRENHKI